MIVNRSISILAILMLFSGIIFSQTSFDKFTTTYFDSDVVLQKDVLDSSGIQYTLVKFNGKDYFVLDQSSSPVVDKAKIATILKDDLLHDSNFAAKMSQVKSDMGAFETARLINDSDCRRLTGTTGLPANDVEEAKRACQANPNCQMGFYNAPNAMELTVSWYTNSTTLSTDVAEFIKNADSLSASKQNVASQLALLSKIEGKVSNMETNIMFLTQLGEGGYEYCSKIDYSKPTLASIRSSLESMQTVMGQVETVDSWASTIVTNSNSQSEYAKNKAPFADALKSKTLASSSQLRLDFDELNSKVNMASLGAKVTLLEDYSKNISKLSSEGKYSQAMALEKPFNTLFADTESEFKTQKNKYAALSASLKSTKAKIASAKQAVSGDSLAKLAGYEAQVSEIEGKTKSQMATDEVSSYSSRLATIDSEVNGVIAQAALSGNTKAPATTQDAAGSAAASVAGIALPSFIPVIPSEYIIGAVVVVGLVFVIFVVGIILVVKKLFFSKGKPAEKTAEHKDAKKK